MERFPQCRFIEVLTMPRLARVVIADVAHHVTQRGNGRQFLLATDTERLVYMDMLRQAVRVHGLLVLGYCLMSNHVHLGVAQRRFSISAAQTTPNRRSLRDRRFQQSEVCASRPV